MVKTKDKDIKIVFIEVTKEEHTEIKRRAAISNITMKQYILQAVEDRIKKDKKYE